MVLAVDPGARRIGLAVSDETGRVALPLETLERAPGEGVEALARRVAERARLASAHRVVVGLPVRLDGREGPAARAARRLGQAVARASGLRVEYWDERLSTVQAERALRAAGVPGRHRRGMVDRTVATLLLQSYLDAIASRRAGP
ncbi:MAG: Holliday junction resolvase RuvX [Myxococcota bacterium]|nr:Holliday junction resolvase RuvX [Myxococcota bacterium]MDW8362191.1 Holliday junction resolvase RuvX [Myxococcales bacterium]